MPPWAQACLQQNRFYFKDPPHLRQTATCRFVGAPKK